MNFLEKLLSRPFVILHFPVHVFGIVNKVFNQSKQLWFQQTRLSTKCSDNLTIQTTPMSTQWTATPLLHEYELLHSDKCGQTLFYCSGTHLRCATWFHVNIFNPFRPGKTQIKWHHIINPSPFTIHPTLWGVANSAGLPPTMTSMHT